MSMINARGTTNGSAYAMWSVMLYGTCKQTDHGCTSCPTSMLSLRSQPLSSALLLKNKPREQHECKNLMHSDLVSGRFLLSRGGSRVRDKGQVLNYHYLPAPLRGGQHFTSLTVL